MYSWRIKSTVIIKIEFKKMELKDKSADEATREEKYVPRYKRITSLTVITDFTSLKSSNEESKGSNGQSSSPTFEVFMETKQDELR